MELFLCSLVISILNKQPKIEKYFWEEKKYLFNLETEPLKSHPRIYLYHQILMSATKIFNIGQKMISPNKKKKKTLFKRNTKDIILEGGWIMKLNIPTAQDLSGTF